MLVIFGFSPKDESILREEKFVAENLHTRAERE